MISLSHWGMFPSDRDETQRIVVEWGNEIVRSARFIEEAVKLVQDEARHRARALLRRDGHSPR